MSFRDETLKDYATPRQWEILCAVWDHGSNRKAATALKVQSSTVDKVVHSVEAKAARQGYSPDHDMLRPAPDGFHIRGTSTLYGEDGQQKAQWVKTSIDHERQAELFRDAIEALCLDLPKSKPVKPAKSHESDLLACYPVGDHHLGMYSWHQETGRDYDLDLGASLLDGAMTHLIESAPSFERALLVFLGDYLHYDSKDPLTPKSKNLLDSDGRFQKMVEIAVISARMAVEKALKRHKSVHVKFIPGNHDPFASVFLQVSFGQIFSDEPRVTVDTSPSEFQYFTHGANLIGCYHGHRVKMAQLPLIMATDQPEHWGRTKHRYWWTGHVHNDQMKDFTGCKVESFRVLPPVDAWAHSEGYRSMSDMKSIILHKEYGEVQRTTVNPAMLS